MTKIRRYDLNGGGERYYSQPYIEPMLPSGYSIQRNGTVSPDVATLIDQPIVAGGWPTIAQQTIADQRKLEEFRQALLRGNGLVYKSPGLIDPSQVVGVVDAVNGNGEKVEIAVDQNGEVLAEKKAPPNIVPLALAAAAAWFFLM